MAQDKKQELIEKIRAAQEMRGGVKSISIQSPVSKESMEIMSEAELENAINAFKRELKELENPAPRIFNIQATKGYRT